MNDIIAGGTGRRHSHSSCRGRADLHVHTLYSDGGQSPEAVVRAAAGRLDVVAITDHDRIAGALRGRDYAREHPELGVDVVIGEEISTLNGHLLALYLEERVPPGLSAHESIRRIHDQGGLAVAASPRGAAGWPRYWPTTPTARISSADAPRRGLGCAGVGSRDVMTRS